ncbi:hypothetical protein Ahy_A04g018643 [Arachis hypogaea]|uniref:Serine-threonine/tyrosine-protein kinase catalytic domain-containing protein n=1 Tax=Arachis hypogaea TaxID=3818 RepID=A0A445DE67_ARAHY|nr:hypothetical protein Ahy_A04g018643 [Arachis hypogaea]
MDANIAEFNSIKQAFSNKEDTVAMKVINESKGSGEKFINEVASINRTFHVNIVLLLEFCNERNIRALIYEFMFNDSLDKFIYGNGSPTPTCNLD